ncbi:MAG: hypothetical protein F9K47_05455 [Burkholderiales bacterium]|nr:MAG: hypothetical protein F9K47_05455 [Burkholderiales bacterium]CAG0998867.1 hypothetical protein MYXO_02872 [Myxococcaceae bacterium]
MSTIPALDLHHQLERMRAFYAARPTPRPERELALAHWQAVRLRQSYADLHVQARYAEALDFFLSDLYGAQDFSRRDADIERIYPVMVKVLPETVLDTVARAMEVNILSQELDRALAARLPAARPIAEASYAAAYRACANRAERERQIALIERVGRDLDRIVKKPFIYATLKLLRTPAKLAGLDEMQHFLERGFASFRTMHGAEEFLATLVARETQVMERLFAGDEAPFSLQAFSNN